MHVLRVFLLPLVFLSGLVFFAYILSGLFSSDLPCDVDTCPRTLSEGDSENVFTYASATEFSVRLDERKNSYKDLHCNPAGIIEVVSFTKETPYYIGVFRAIAPGMCMLESNTFSAKIVIR